MYVTIRKYSGTGDPKEINRVCMAELLPILEKVSGFKSYTTVELGRDAVMSIGIFDSKASAEAANASAREMIGRHLAKLLPNPPEIIVGEILGQG